jgi:hypothetical protein
MIQHILRYLITRLGVPLESIHVEGIIRFRRIPDDWSEAEYRHWWLPEWNSDHTKIIREARLTPADKDRFTAHEVHNILTTNGRTYILTYMASSASNTSAFAQYFAVGNFPISTVAPGQTGLVNEIFRGQPSTVTITGTSVDIATILGASQAVGTLYEAGLFGNNATSTANSGTMMTSAMLGGFVKANGPVYSCDYVLNLQ